MSIKIKDAPTTTVKSTLMIPVGNVGDNEAHTITLSALKTWITSAGSGGIRWTEILERPNVVTTDFIKTVNGSSIVGEGNLVVEADSIQWSKVVNKPTIPTKVSELDNDLEFISETQGENDFQSKLVSGKSIATVNGYDLLAGGNIVIEGTEQEQSDWNEDDSGKPSYIKNKPAINNSRITIRQGGVTKGSFTVNSSTNVTVNLDEGGSGVPTYKDITDTSATPVITIEGNQVVRCTNEAITSVTFKFDDGYLEGGQRELTSTVYLTCPKTAPEFVFPESSHIYGDFENMTEGVQYIISIQGDNFILTPSHITWNDISEKPNVQIQPDVIELGGTNNDGVWQVTINELKPNTIYKCTFATRVVVKAVANGCGTGHYPTRIYMEYPHTAQGDKEGVMHIQMPSAWKTIGMGGELSMFRQDGEFNPFYVEFRMGYAESVGNNYSV